MRLKNLDPPVSEISIESSVNFLFLVRPHLLEYAAKIGRYYSEICGDTLVCCHLIINIQCVGSECGDERPGSRPATVRLTAMQISRLLPEKICVSYVTYLPAKFVALHNFYILYLVCL